MSTSTCAQCRVGHIKAKDLVLLVANQEAIIGTVTKSVKLEDEGAQRADNASPLHCVALAQLGVL